MPIGFALDIERKLIYSRYFDRVTEKDVAAAYPKIFKAMNGWGHATEIADLTEVSHMDVPVQSIRDTAERTATMHKTLHLQGTKFIVASSDVIYGFARIYSAHAAFVGALEVTVVRSLAEAQYRLNLTENILDPLVAEVRAANN